MAENVFFHDFGKAAFGILEIEISGIPGTPVEISLGEAVENGRVNRHPGGSCCVKTGTFTLNAPRNIYKFEIPRHKAPKYTRFSIPSPVADEIAPFRYAEVAGLCEVHRFIRREIFPVWDENDADFVSSNDDLNRVWEFCKYSIKATSAFGIFIDGERERCPYEGDTYINQLAWFCCSRFPEIPRRTIEFFKDNATWPIEWSLLMPLIVRDYLLYSGDASTVKEMLPFLNGRLLDELEREDGLIGGNDEYRELIDWPMAERDGYETSGVSLVPNCMRFAALQAMGELTGDCSFFVRAEKLKQIIRAKMFRNGIFTDSPESSHTAGHSCFFPVATGVASPAEICGLAEQQIKCSVYAVQFLLDALYMGNYGQQALDLLCSRELRSWLHMLDIGATITLEAWDPSLKPNLDWNHAWGAAPADIIPRRLCGIRPLKPGFREFVFDPQPGNLEYFKSVHPTPHGGIQVEYDSGRFSVIIPDGCRAFFRGEYCSGELAGEL